MDPDDGAPEASNAEAVMVAMQRSLDAVRNVLETTSRQAAVIASLEAELAREGEHARKLEGETARLRAELTAGRPLPEEIEALIEEQNVLTHLFVASDRLARARAPREALDVAVEVLHNLAGVHRYAVWVRSAPDEALRIAAPADPRYRLDRPPGELVDRALAKQVVARAAGGGDVPVAYPLLLDGRAVGAIEIHELVPHVGRRLGRLQEDLLQFLSDRLAPAMCRSALAAREAPATVWAGVATAIEEKSR